MPGNPYEEIVRDRDVAFVPPHPPMPADRVRFAGGVVAMVVAETPAAARDGAERVDVDWTPLPAVTGSLAAAGAEAPVLYDESASNVCVDVEAGDREAVDRGVRPRRSRGAPGHVGPARHRRADGAARRGGGVGRPEPALHRARRRGRARPDAHGRGRRARCGRERGAGHRGRRGRQLRHAQQLLPGVRAGRVGGSAPRPAREVDGRPQRGVSRRLPGPGPRRAGRAGAGRRRATSWPCAARTPATSERTPSPSTR